MRPNKKIGNKHIVAIVIVVVSVGALYLVLANLLFSRTYEMLSESMRSRGESHVSRLAELVSWGLAAQTQKDVDEVLQAFLKSNPDTLEIVVLDADGGLFTRAGRQELSSFTRAWETPESTTSRMHKGHLVAMAPSRSEFIDEPVGYVIYSESRAGYLKYRRNMLVIAILASILGLAIVGKLLQSQISISIENEKLLDSLKEQASHLRATNIDLQKEIEVRTRAEAELSKYQLHLEELVEERTEELQRTKDRLVDASRKAGMAEVATGVLHNVGNVLNSVNVSADLIQNMVNGLHIDSLRRATEMIQEHSGDLGTFMTEDKKGQMLPKYLVGLVDVLEKERTGILEKVQNLTTKIDQIKAIVVLQQSYAGMGGATEKCSLKDIIEDAIQINIAGFERHGAKVMRDYQPTPSLVVDKQKAIQIIVNLLSNAKYAMKPQKDAEHLVTVRTGVAEQGTVEVIVEDNGVGIPLENITRIFSYGFTTRKQGHGFGLHSSANAAKELGGSLSAHSDGEGTGARFVLKIPLESKDGQYD